MTPYTSLDAERAHQAILRERKTERENYKIAAALAALGDVRPNAIRIACPIRDAKIIDYSYEPIGENSIAFAQYARRMRDWKRRGETTKISPKTHPIEWSWSQGRPALGFRPECVPVAFEYLSDEEQLDYLKRTSISVETTFVAGETMDTRLSDPIPDYIQAREVGFDLTSIELAFQHDDENEDSDAEPGAARVGEDGYCRPEPLGYTDRFGWAPPTPYMRSWVDWERRRKLSGDVIRVYPICKDDMIDFQVEGLPRVDGNTAAKMRNDWRMRAVTSLVEDGYTGSLSWYDFQNWLDFYRGMRERIGMTKAQEELYYHAPALEAEQERWTWVDREYQEVYEAPEELTDQQMRDGEQPRMLLHLRTHKNRAAAENSLRPDVQNSPNILGLHPDINWLRDDEDDDVTYSERVRNYLDGVEAALYEAFGPWLDKVVAALQTKGIPAAADDLPDL